MGKNPFSLIDLGSLSEPVTKLIETISNVIGILYEPTRIRRKAKAEVDAAIIKAEGDIKLQELKERAQERLKFVELRRQKNIESIITIAIQQLPDSVSKDPVDEDWVAYFFNQSQDVSNEQMQTVWARILAGEVTSPGTYSLRTLNSVKMLNQKGAILFEQCTRFLCDKRYLFIGGRASEYLESAGLSNEELILLESLGIFVNRDVFRFFNNKEYTFHYFDRGFELTPRGDLPVTSIQFYQLSDIGSELLNLSNSLPDNNYFDALYHTLYYDLGLNVYTFSEDLEMGEPF